MRRRTDRGFTLLELMLSIVIIGIMLGLGMAFFTPSTSSLSKTARALARDFSAARVGAMLGRRAICLEFEGAGLFKLDGQGGKTLVRVLPAGIGLVIDGKAMLTSGKERFVFGPLGHTAERYIYLHDGREAQTIYLPSIGAPVARAGMIGLAELREAGQQD